MYVLFYRYHNCVHTLTKLACREAVRCQTLKLQNILAGLHFGKKKRTRYATASKKTVSDNASIIVWAGFLVMSKICHNYF